MRSKFTPFLFTGLVALVPGALLAQQEQAPEADEAPACTVTVEPAELPAGEAAVHLIATLSEDVGPITAFEAPAESGVVTASPEAIPMAEMAAEGEDAEAPKPIELGDEANVFSVWLSTEEAAAGAFDVKFLTGDSYCAARLTVVTAGETDDEPAEDAGSSEGAESEGGAGN